MKRFATRVVSVRGWRRFVSVMVLAVVAVAGGAAAVHAVTAPAAVPAIPTGRDCLRPPTPHNPDRGVLAMIDPGPANPRDGDPFDKNSGVSMYDVYGYAGYELYLFDPGCMDMKRVYDPDNAKANANIALSASMIAFTVRLTELATSDMFGKMFDPIREKTQSVLGEGLFLPFLGLGLAVTGVLIIYRSKDGDLAGETHAAVSSLTLVTVAAATLLYSGVFVGAVDGMLTGSFKAAAQIASGTVQQDNDRDIGDVLAANMVNSILYPSWAAATFGDDKQAAEKYGPALFRAGALTRKEAAAIAAKPETADDVIEKRKNEYKDIAAKVEAEYPAAYSYMTGNRASDQMHQTLLAMITTVAVTGFLLYSIVRLLWAMAVVRVGFGMAPAVALVAQVPRWNHLALELVTWVFQALVTAVVFGFVFNVYLAGAVGGILGANDGNTITKTIALVMATFALVFVLKRLGLAGGAWKRIDVKKRRQGSSQEKPKTPARPAPGSGGGGGSFRPSGQTTSPYTGPVKPSNVVASNVRPVGAAANQLTGAVRPMAAIGSGAAAGAAAGSVVPGVGTVAGASTGAVRSVLAGQIVRSTATAAASRTVRATPGGRVPPPRGTTDRPYAATITTLEPHPRNIQSAGSIPMPTRPKSSNIPYRAGLAELEQRPKA